MVTSVTRNICWKNRLGLSNIEPVRDRVEVSIWGSRSIEKKSFWTWSLFSADFKIFEYDACLMVYPVYIVE